MHRAAGSTFNGIIDPDADADPDLSCCHRRLRCQLLSDSGAWRLDRVDVTERVAGRWWSRPATEAFTALMYATKPLMVRGGSFHHATKREGLVHKIHKRVSVFRLCNYSGIMVRVSGCRQGALQYTMLDCVVWRTFGIRAAAEVLQPHLGQ